MNAITTYESSCRIDGVVYRYEIKELKTVFHVWARRAGSAFPIFQKVTVKRDEIPPYEITGFEPVDRSNLCKAVMRVALAK